MISISKTKSYSCLTMVIPEMDCDLTKRGDKIDYDIMKDNTQQ